MNNSRSLLRFAVALLGALTACQLASAFEGKVDMTITTADGSMPMTYYIKETRVRTEMVIKGEEEKPKRSKKKNAEAAKPEQATSIRAVSIIKMDSRDILMFTENLVADTTKGGEDQAPKFYMTMKVPEGDAKAGAKAAPESTFAPTGRTETIAGYKAEEYVSVGKKGERTETWVTKELGQYMMASQGKGGKPGKAKAWEQFAQSGNFFPLRTIQRAKEGGTEEFRMEVVKVDASKIADSLFQVPPCYQPMPGLGDMMRSAIPRFGN